MNNQTYYYRQASFAGGLYGAEMQGRDDMKRYLIGAKEMTNFFPHPYGGFSRRPGTQFIHKCKLDSKKVRLVPFIYSTGHAFVLEFGDKYVRYYRDGGIVMNGSTIVETTTPYPAGILDELRFVQSADRMYICHSDYPVKTLSRNSDVNWTLSDYTTTRGPFAEQNTTDTTITPSAKTGTVTLTASSAIFNSAMVGMQITLSHHVYSQSASYKYQSGAVTTKALICNGDWDFQVTDPYTTIFHIQISDDNGATWKDLKKITCFEDGSGVTDSGHIDHLCLLRVYAEASSDGSGHWAINCDPVTIPGFATITGYTDSTHVTAKVYTDINDYVYGFASTEATPYWSLGAWGPNAGYPSVAGFYQDRLFFGSTKSQPLTIWGSETGNYPGFYTHDTPEDADAVSFSLVSNQVNRPKHLVSLSSLMAFTEASEWLISSGSSQASITPDSISARQQTAEGCNDLAPLIVGDRMLFVTNTGNFVRDIAYDYSTDSYKGDDQTAYNRDLFKGYDLVSWCSQPSPNNVIWACRSDGKLLSFTYIKDEDVRSWAIHETDGYFESCCSIPGDEQDEVYFVVQRKVNGETKRYIEMLSHETTDIKLPLCLDSLLYYAVSTAISSVSGLDHLEGKSVSVIADGAYRGEFTVSGGKIALGTAATTVVAGLNYKSTFESLDIPVPRQDGTSFARKKKISRIVVKLRNSYSGKVGINGTDRLTRINMQKPGAIGAPAALYTTDYHIEPAGGYEYEAHVDIVQDEPYPLNVLAFVAEVAMG